MPTPQLHEANSWGEQFSPVELTVAGAWADPCPANPEMLVLDGA